MTGFVSHISPGCIVRVAERGDKEAWQHRLFGMHSIAGAVSPNSGRPLLRLLQLDMADPRSGLNGGPGEVLPLLFSWSCAMSQSPVIYRVKSSTAVELMVYRRGKVYGDFPYSEYPTHFPERIAALVPIPATE